MAGHLFPERPPGRFFFGRKDGQDERARLLALIQGRPCEPTGPMVMLQFDADTTRLLENAYRGSDVVKRRLATLEALAPRAGETIVDVGSGPGYLTLELSRAVGEAGEVIGVDPSATCEGQPQACAMASPTCAFSTARQPRCRSTTPVRIGRRRFRCSSISATFLGLLSRSGGCCAPEVASWLGTCTGMAGSGTATNPGAWRR